uniref:Uncharacterized protein n=1 Tax=Oryza nivara TaxID=4536 RepID=A0A0E0IVU6_ORYNI
MVDNDETTIRARILSYASGGGVLQPAETVLQPPSYTCRFRRPTPAASATASAHGSPRPQLAIAAASACLSRRPPLVTALRIRSPQPASFASPHLAAVRRRSLQLVASHARGLPSAVAASKERVWGGGEAVKSMSQFPRTCSISEEA